MKCDILWKNSIRKAYFKENSTEINCSVNITPAVPCTIREIISDRYCNTTHSAGSIAHISPLSNFLCCKAVKECGYKACNLSTKCQRLQWNSWQITRDLSVNKCSQVQYNGFNTTMLKYIFKNLLQFQWSSQFLALVTAATCLFVQLRTAALRLIVRSWLDVPTFATRRLHASPRESTLRRNVKLWARNVRQILPKFRHTRYI